jgi:hypothetical protein
MGTAFLHDNPGAKVTSESTALRKIGIAEGSFKIE